MSFQYDPVPAYEEMQVAKVYPSWRKVLMTPAFGRWLDSPEADELRPLKNSDWAKDAIRIIDAYKAHVLRMEFLEGSSADSKAVT